METKQFIRAQALQRRKALNKEQIEAYSRMITGTICARADYQNADQILIYVDYNHEVITRFLIEDAWKKGKCIYVPKVLGKTMDFFRISSWEDLKPGIKGILEPDGHSQRAENLTNALMIMPGVAFDHRKHRIGYGGGFYDRYLQQHPSVRTIAVAFELQLFDEVPHEDFDLSPDVLITEKEIY